MKSKGFRKIDNDTFYALMAAPLTGSEYKVILAIVNQTWGFGKTCEAIKLDTFEKLTGLTRPGIVKAIQKLKLKGIIATVSPRAKRGPKSTVTYAITDPSTWKVSKPQLSNSPPVVSKPQLSNSATTVYQVSKQATPEGEPVKILSKDILKDITVGTAKKQSAPQPLVTLILDDIKAYLGYPRKTDKDPIPNYGKEGQAIKRMLTRGFTRDEILTCWKGKVADRTGDFVSMVWVNEDIGKKSGNGAHRQSPRRLPKTYRTPEEIFGNGRRRPRRVRPRDSYTKPEDY